MFKEFCNQRGRILAVLAILLDFSVIQSIGVSPLPEVPDMIPSIPADCKTNYCENVLNYPSDAYIAEALKMRYIEPIDDVSISKGLAKREINNADEVQLCRSTTRVIFPKTAQDLKTNQWVFIMNTDKYRQGVRVEICANGDDKNECNIIAGLLPSYKSTCTQLYVERVMVSLNSTNNVELSSVKMPSSCCCRMKYIVN